MKRMIAAAKAGESNVTLVTRPMHQTPIGFEALAEAISRKKPGMYYVFEVNDRGQKHGEPIATWYVGEGFSHEDGWWVT